MTRKSVMSLALAASLLMVCGSMLAHHGTAISYDQTTTITLKGTVTEFVWSNPHAYVLFDVQDDGGNVVHWAAEGSSPRNWRRRGWNRDSLKPGDEITITMHPSKAGSPVGVVTNVVLASGEELTR